MQDRSTCLKFHFVALGGIFPEVFHECCCFSSVRSTRDNFNPSIQNSPIFAFFKALHPKMTC